MRTLGLVGLVLALVIVGFTMKKQVAAVAPAPAVSQPSGEGSAATMRTQSQQIQQQVRQQLDAAMSRPRPGADDN